MTLVVVELLLIGAVVFCGLAAEANLGELLEHEYYQYRSQWERDGRPAFRGMPKEYYSWRAHRRAVWLRTKWVLAAPGWIAADADLRPILWRARLWALAVLVIAAVAWFVGRVL